MIDSGNKLWRRDFVFLASANLIMAIAFYFMVPILPVFLEDVFSADAREIGITLSGYTLAAILIRPFAGYALDAIGRRGLYLAAFSLFTLMHLGYPWAFSILFLIIVRFLHGFAWGAMSTAGSTIIVDIVPPSRRGEGIGIYGLSMTIAMALGPVIAIAITSASNYRTLFFSAMAFSVIGLSLALLVKVPKIRHKSSPFSFKKLFEKSAIPTSVNLLFTMIPYGGVMAFIALYGKSIGVENSGLFFILIAIGIAISRVSSGRIFDRIGPKRVSVVGLILLIIGFVLIGWLNNAIGFHVAAFVLGFGFGVLMPTFQAMANHGVTPERRGAANSTFLTFLDLGIGFGMFIFGILIEWLGYAHTFFLCAALEIASLLLFLTFTMPRYGRSRE